MTSEHPPASRILRWALRSPVMTHSPSPLVGEGGTGGEGQGHGGHGGRGAGARRERGQRAPPPSPRVGEEGTEGEGQGHGGREGNGRLPPLPAWERGGRGERGAPWGAQAFYLPGAVRPRTNRLLGASGLYHFSFTAKYATLCAFIATTRTWERIRASHVPGAKQ